MSNQNISQSKINLIVKKHQNYLVGKPNGQRANLSGLDLSGLNLGMADLREADLHGATLSNAYMLSANLSGADLSDAKLAGATLCHAVLTGANLSRAFLFGTNLSLADLSWADLRGAYLADASLHRSRLRKADLRNADLGKVDLREADLFGAKLCRANLSGAILIGAHLSKCTGLDTAKMDAFTSGVHLIPPVEGEYTAWKRVADYLVKLLIPADALRSSATTRNCRASKATVLGIYTLKNEPASETAVHSRVHSSYADNFIYRVGETVSVPNFDTDRWNECAPGIHHFVSMQEAINY